MSRDTMTYLNLRRKYFSEHPSCEARIAARCSMNAHDIHHTKGRGKYYLDVLTWLAVCRTCHMWIENNPKDAKELGFSSSRN